MKELQSGYAIAVPRQLKVSQQVLGYLPKSFNLEMIARKVGYIFMCLLCECIAAELKHPDLSM